VLGVVVKSSHIALFLAAVSICIGVVAVFRAPKRRVMQPVIVRQEVRSDPGPAKREEVQRCTVFQRFMALGVNVEGVVDTVYSEVYTYRLGVMSPYGMVLRLSEDYVFCEDEGVRTLVCRDRSLTEPQKVALYLDQPVSASRSWNTPGVFVATPGGGDEVVVEQGGKREVSGGTFSSSGSRTKKSGVASPTVRRTLFDESGITESRNGWQLPRERPVTQVGGGQVQSQPYVTNGISVVGGGQVQ